MPITPIAAYELPGPAELPDSVLGWRPDPHRSALLVHDMQEYFLTPFDAAFRAVLVGQVERLVAAAHRTGVPVVYTAQPGSMTPAQRGLLAARWGPGMERVPENTAITERLLPSQEDVVVTKWRYSAFHGNELASVLADRRRDQVVIAGVYAHVGCQVTAAESFSRDLETFVVADATADFDRARHLAALAWMSATCALPMLTDHVVQHWETSSLQHAV